MILADVANWLTAIGTLLAVIVALFGPPLYRWWTQPKLRFGTASEAGAVLNRIDNKSPTLWLRLPVTNKGRSTAEDVSVIIGYIQAKPQPEQKPPPRELKWADQKPPPRELKWADIEKDHVKLPPNVTRLVDICHMRVDHETGRTGLVSGAIPIEWEKKNNTWGPASELWCDLETSTQYQIPVNLSGKDVSGRKYTVSFHLDPRSNFPTNQTNLKAAKVEPPDRKWSRTLNLIRRVTHPSSRPTAETT